MLTIRKIQVEVGDASGALAAANYPLEMADSPQAYREAGEEGPERANSMWLGSPEALGQFGVERGAEVKVEELAQVMRGRHVDSTEERVRQVRVPGHVPEMQDGKEVIGPDGKPVQKPAIATYDLTFSAPKSVSIVWSLADGDLRARIEQAMMVASNAALEHLAMTRPIVEGGADGFAASATLHVSARQAKADVVPLPQLHVHAYLLAVLDKKGVIRAPLSAALYKHSAMREAGAVARAALAAELKKIGFGIEAMTGRGGRYFEIEGVPVGLRERMSSRSREVREWIAERTLQRGGALSGREASRAAMATRGAKRPDLSKAFIQDVWRALAQDFFFDRRKLEGLLAAVKVERDPVEVTVEVRAAILARIRAEGPTVSTGAARSIAFETAPAGITLEEAGQLLEQMQEGELIAVGGWRVTTREIHEQELYVEKVATEAAVRGRAPLGAEAVRAGIEAVERSSGFELDPEQKEAVAALTGGAGWACLTGRAGTGKGPVLAAVAEAHRREGWQVIASAVDGATSGRLAVQVRGEALTIEQLLFRLGAGTVTIDGRTPTLILIEEASKVGLDHWEKIAAICEETGAAIIPIGDVKQIGAIECPGMFDVMLGVEDGGERDENGEKPGPRQTVIPVARLQKVRRHKDPDYRGPNGERRDHPWLGKHLDHLYEERGAEAIKVLRDEGAITMEDTREGAMEAMVERWRERRAAHGIVAKDSILVVHGPNTDVDEVNELAQRRRFEDGELGRDGVQAVDRRYSLHENDVVMLRETAYRQRDGVNGGWERVENGTLGVVCAVDVEGERVEVRFELAGDETRDVWIDLGALREWAASPARGEDSVPSLRLAYAAHPFPVQGGTWRYVGSLLGHWSQRLEDAYVANSRAQEYLDVFTDRESCGLEGDDEDRYRRLGKRLSLPWHRQASIAYKETRGVKIFQGLAEHEPAPLLARGEAAPVRDSLGSYRQLLGASRLTAIELRAGEAAAEMGRLEGEDMRLELASGRRAAEFLDPAAALEIGRIERNLPALEEEAAASRGRVPEEGGRGGVFGRRGREAERAAAERMAEQDEAAVAELRDRADELRDEGRHPDDWMREQGERFARGLAAERELRARGELEEEESLERGAGTRVSGPGQEFDGLEGPGAAGAIDGLDLGG
jgi:conjugative relaxase-like TrwC/TraI family protein